MSVDSRSATASPGPYDEPIVYDILHAPGTAEEVEGLFRMARRWHGLKTPRPRWLEPACGTGRYLRAARRRGVHVEGFDSNRRMVAYARQRLRRIADDGWRVFVADLGGFATNLPPHSVDFAFNLQNTLRLLHDDASVLAHLHEVSRVLRPGSVYAVGLDLASYGRESVTEDVWTGSRGGFQVTQVVQYLPPPTAGSPRRERVISHLVVQRTRGIAHRDHVFELRTYDGTQWHRLIGRSPFEIADVVDETGRSTKEQPFAYGIHLLRCRDQPRRRV